MNGLVDSASSKVDKMILILKHNFTLLPCLWNVTIPTNPNAEKLSVKPHLLPTQSRGKGEEIIALVSKLDHLGYVKGGAWCGQAYLSVDVTTNALTATQAG